MHERAIQMLVGFDAVEPLSYWNNLVETYGDNYAPLASQGVFNLDFDTGVNWLINHKNLQKVLDVFITCLPYYYETQFGIAKCDEAIKRLIPHVSPKYAKMIALEQQNVKDWLKREAKKT